MSALAVGQRLVVDCSGLDDEGAGFCHADGVRVHIARALPGEAVATRVAHVSPHAKEAWGDLETIERASGDRVETACGAYGRCGGCVLQHLAYPAQAAWKRERLVTAFAAQPALASVGVEPTVASPRPLGYRNNAKLVFGRTPAGNLALGAWAPRTHDLVDLAGCRVVEPALEAVADELRTRLAAADIAPYDERRTTGLLRYVVLRSAASGGVLVTLVTARAEFPGGREFAVALVAARPEVTGVVQNVNPTRGNTIFGGEDHELAGAPKLEDTVGPVRLVLSPRAFFQSNRTVATLAYTAIAEAIEARPGEHIVDAYSGVGGIALTIACGVPGAEILGIESHPAATADAVESARLSGAANVRFVTKDAAGALRAIDRTDAIVLNPPRRGCTPDVLAEVARLAPTRLAYLSCDPDTLARNLSALVAHGFAVDRVTPFDMLPHTPHVEALAILRRA